MARRAWKRRSSSSPTRPPIRPSSAGFRGRSIFRLPDVGEVPLIRPRKAERVSPFAETHRRRGGRATSRSIGGCSTSALTRAEERLVIAGLQPKAKGGVRPENCWHTPRRAGARFAWARNRMSDARLGRGAALPRHRPRRCGQAEACADCAPGTRAFRRGPKPPLLREARPPQPLAPSAIAEDSEAAPPPSEAQRAAAERGTFIHQLLERLAPSASRTSGTPPRCAGSNGRRA